MQSSKVVSWPNSVLVAPLRVARQSYSVAPLGVVRPKRPATPPSEKMQCLMGLGTQWRDSGHLSRQWCWRDKPTLSLQRLRVLVSNITQIAQISHISHKCLKYHIYHQTSPHITHIVHRYHHKSTNQTKSTTKLTSITKQVHNKSHTL